MAFFNLKTLWRGPSLKLLLSFTRASDNSSAITTELIDLDGLAQVRVKLTCIGSESEDFQVNLMIKKNETAKMLTVFITILEYEEQIICPREWATLPIKIIKPYNYIKFNDGRKVHAYTLEINITVHVTMPAAPVISSELYEDTEFTDFELDATDGTVAVHKTVLLIHGDMFRTMLRGDWKETKENRINIKGASVETLQHLKEYMYLGTLPDEGLEPLLIIASRYLMEKLEAHCITKLIESLKPEKFDGLIELACQNNIPQLMRGLVLRTPDNIVNGIHKLKINEKESNDKNN